MRSYRHFALLSRLDLVQSIPAKVEKQCARRATSMRTAAGRCFGAEREKLREKVRAGFKPALTKFISDSANIFASSAIPKYPTVCRPDPRKHACRWGKRQYLSVGHRLADHHQFSSAQIRDASPQARPGLSWFFRRFRRENRRDRSLASGFDSSRHGSAG